MSGSGPVDTRVLAYAESPFERIVDVHWKKTDGGPGEGPPCDGPCGDGWLFAPSASTAVHLWIGGIRGPDHQFPPVGGGSGVVWNPTSCCPATPIGFNPADGSFDPQYFIPGNCATHLKITLRWSELVVGSNNFYFGFWIFEGRTPYPPYWDINDPTQPPPPNMPPNDPDLFQYMNDSASGELVGYDRDDWGGVSVVVGPVAGVPGARQIVTASGRVDPNQMNAIPRDGPPPHYGQPGTEPEFGGAWLDIEFACPEGSSFLTPLTPRLLRSSRGPR
jgi:hypothetical protein